jgi:hypothetical protein
MIIKTIYKVTLISFLWLIVISSLRLGIDTSSRLKMTHAWLTGTDEITLPADYKAESRLVGITVGVLGREGKRYIPYDVGQPLLMLPGDWLGTQLHKAFPNQNDIYFREIIVRWVTFIPLNIALIAACFWLLKVFKFTERVAAFSSITTLLGTTVLYYAQSSQQNNQVLLFVVLAYACAIVATQAQSQLKNHIFLLLSGLSGGAAFLLRQTSILHLLTIFIFTVICSFKIQKNLLETIKTTCLWALGVLPMVLISRIFDYIRFGVFWTTGANLAAEQLATDPIDNGLPKLPANFPFNNPPWVGIWGVLFSPAKSIFIYDPLLIPCLLLSVICWKKLNFYLRVYIITIILNFILHLAFYSKLDFWHGDPGWSSRYHVTSVHLLLIPLVGLLIQNLLNAKRSYLWSIRLLLIIAIAFQIPSVFFRPSAESNRIYFAKPESFLELRWTERVTNIGCLINDSLATNCSQRLALDSANPLITKASLWPLEFTGKRNLALIAWSILLVIAIIATWQFYIAIIY